MKILIAEDDTVSRLILQKAIEKLGHECLSAADGAEAWQLYQHTTVDVVVSDWMMPGLDGRELCHRVREQAREAYPSFIFLTALSDKAHVLTGMLAGADDYLTKPLDRDELQVKLVAAARVTALHRQLAAHKAELERLNQQLFTQARRDPLTGLGNRLQLGEDLDVLRARVERYGHSYSIVLCDVDCFKRYNDSYGHLAGDDVLRRVGQLIAHHSRGGDTAYRYGGEEFLLILPEQSVASATIVVERLRHAVEGLAIPHCTNTAAAVVTISAGLAALVPGEPRSVDSVLQGADTALYRAKEAGRNSIAV
jgi:diguanylate cyclase (GGDEF)-like protein